MPFGLTNAPATFQRLMQLVLQGLTWEQALPYLDDIITPSRTFDEQLVQLRMVFDKLLQAGLTLKPSKCHFCQSKVQYVGHIVSNDGLCVDPAKIAAVPYFPVPKNVSQLKSFLGLAGYYRRFINNFSRIASPLYKLQERKNKWQWTDDCAAAFLQLQRCLTTAPILTFPCFSVPFTLYTDASSTALGAVLAQETDGKERVIACKPVTHQGGAKLSNCGL